MHSDPKKLKFPLGAVNWGDLRRDEPISQWWGLDRGLPIDRYYVEGVIEKNSELVRGRCLEVKDGHYARKFGRERLESLEVVDINSRNPEATIIGDLQKAETLDGFKFDCIILTQVLPHIFDFNSVLSNCIHALKPGGTLLLSVPTMVSYAPEPNDYWRFTKDAIERMAIDLDGCVDPEVLSFGNLKASIGFLMGLAAEEFSSRELDYVDPRFPIVVVAKLRRQANDFSDN